MKKMFIYRIVCTVLALSMIIASFSSCGKTASGGEEQTTAAEDGDTTEQITYSEKAGSVTKSETVFVNLKHDGKPENIVVSDWLHTDKPGVRVEDISDSKSIINVKGLEEPVIDGENIIWNMRSTDLYYRGFGDKELPVDVNIDYKLNGTSVSPEKMKGEDGKLELGINLKNNITKTVKIDGKDEQIYCPFLVIGGMILSDPNYTDVNVKGGKVIADGAHQAALFVSIPGLRESLALDELNISDIGGYSLADNFSLTANVTDCSLGNMYFAVLPLSAIGFGGFLSDKLEDVEGVVNKLSSVVNSLYDVNADKLIGILTGNSDNITSLISLVNESAELYENNKAFLKVLSKYLTPENTAAIGNLLVDMENVDIASLSSILSDPAVKKLLEDTGNLDFSKYNELLNNPLLKSLFTDMSAVLSDVSAAMPALQKFFGSVSDGQMEKIIADMDALVPMIQGMSEDIKDPEVKKSIDNMPNTVAALNGIIEKLNQNKQLIEEFSQFATEENIRRLEQILENTNQSDLTAILSLAGMSAEVADVVVPRLEAMLKYSAEYKVYSKASEGMKTSVMFVYQTPGI